MISASHRFLVFFLAVNGLLFHSISAQEDFDKSLYRVRFGFTITKQPDDSRVFRAEFSAANKKDRQDNLPIYGAEVHFHNFLEDEAVELGSAMTTREGVAEITLPGAHPYLTDAEGYMGFRAVFTGSDALDEESEELRIRDLNLTLDLSEVDSVRTVTVSAMARDSLGMEVPVSDEFVKVSVGGMLSRLVLEEQLVDGGELQFEFPQDLPGDAEGNITVFAVVEDSDTFGNVVQEQTIGWGMPMEQIRESNKLWSEAAPIWMYVVLTILLVGVWANYAYTIFHLFRIKKEGRKMVMNTEEE